jgi:anti-sigma regulatory factor (Ser/Thr protein kinase)
MLLDREHPLTTLANGRLVVESDPRRWSLRAGDARDAARMRSAFRDYLEQYADFSSDLHAAEAVFGELVANCIAHAPAEIRIEFRWHDRTLVVVDGADRLRTWPFSLDDMRDEATHHAFALISAFTNRIHITRDAGGGTRASVVLAVTRAGHVPVVSADG